MDDHLLDDATPAYGRRSFVKRMVAAGFVVPVVASFGLDSLAQAGTRHGYPNQTYPNQTYPNQRCGRRKPRNPPDPT